MGNETTSEFFRHLSQRGWYPTHESWIDTEQQLITFPLWNGNKLIGYQRYDWRAPKLRSNVGRYYTWASERYREVASYGWEYFDRSGPLFICEGIWDCLRIINAGYSGIALLTSTPHTQLREYLRLRCCNRTIVGIRDNDGAKERITGFSDTTITTPDPYKDLGEMTQEIATEWLTKYIATM